MLLNKAMRYPPTTHKEVDEERLDREKQQEDLVKAIDEEDIGDDFFWASKMTISFSQF